MAGSSFEKGGIFLLLLLSLRLASPQEIDGQKALLDRHETQLHKLENLVETLSKTVCRLESSLSDCSRSKSLDVPSSPASLAQEMGPPPSDPVSGSVERVGGGDRWRTGIAVTKYKPSWSERFQFAAAARLDSEATCATVLPYEDFDGLTKYFAVGDSRGKVYIFSSAGDVLVESSTPSNSAVTSMLAYLSLRKNESFLFTGHSDGSIVAHRIWESAANGDDWTSLSMGSGRMFVSGGDQDSPLVLGLELYQTGRIRYIIATDGGGRIRVFTENGTLFGTGIASSRPLAFVKQRLLFLTERGAGSLDLRSMVVKEHDCEGLNGSLANAYAFDTSERSKAYGLTTGGDLIHVVLLGDAANLKCRVRAVRKSEIDGPVAIQTVKGYLLVVNHEKVFVYNVSSQFYGRVGAPRPLFFTTLEEIKSLFLNSHVLDDGSARRKPLIAADGGRLVVLGLRGGYIGVYRSNFPLFKVQSNAVLWSSPALLFLMLLIGLWHFYVKKKDSLVWTPDESFNVSAGLLGSSPGDRAYTDGSRVSEFRDMRAPGLRGPPRRYVSPPSRYPGGPTMQFRQSSADPGFRGGADLKYRGQCIDPSGFPQRKEPTFGNSQVADDHIE